MATKRNVRDTKAAGKLRGGPFRAAERSSAEAVLRGWDAITTHRKSLEELRERLSSPLVVGLQHSIDALDAAIHRKRSEGPAAVATAYYRHQTAAAAPLLHAFVAERLARGKEARPSGVSWDALAYSDRAMIAAFAADVEGFVCGLLAEPGGVSAQLVHDALAPALLATFERARMALEDARVDQLLRDGSGPRKAAWAALRLLIGTDLEPRRMRPEQGELAEAAAFWVVVETFTALGGLCLDPDVRTDVRAMRDEWVRNGLAFP